jgi:hypothetical protein
MSKPRLSGIAITVLSVLCVFVAGLLIGGGWQEHLGRITGRSLAQPTGTPIYLPLVADSSNAEQRSAADTPLAEETSVSVEETPEPTATSSESDLPIEAYPTEIIHPPVVLTPAPLPSLTVTPESGHVTLSNPRLLSVPIEQHASLGIRAWSPDGNQFMVDAGDNGGSTTPGLYIGNVETGDLQLWQANSAWPAWSRDGQSIYYLSFRSDRDTWIYDLYRKAMASGQADLLRADVGYPYLYQSAAVETASGELIFLDKQRHPVSQPLTAVTASGALPDPLPLLSLIENSGAALADQEVHFSVSPDGRFVALIAPVPPIYLLDLQTGEQIGAIDEVAYYPINVAWSHNGQRLAYATNMGVYVYDLVTAETTTLVTRQDLGFHPEDLRSAMGMPNWSPDGEVVVFVASSPDWNWQLPLEEQRPHSFALTFAVAGDGSAREVLPEYMVESMSPNGVHAIVEDWNGERQLYEKFVVDVIWNE